MSTTNVYTTSTLVEEKLPPSYDNTVLTSAIMTRNIRRASRFIDDRLPGFWTFPDTAGDPATPDTIEQLATAWAAVLCMDTLEITDRFNEESEYQKLRQFVFTVTEQLEDAEMGIDPISVSGETLTFGGTGYASDIAPLANKDVIPKSVVIGTDELWVDFQVFYHDGHRCWVVQRLASLSASTVAYDYTFRKQEEKPTPYGAIGVKRG